MHALPDTSTADTSARRLGLWLLGCFVLVLGLVFIGGLTRLTGSGLSIVEWRPVSGIVPPLGEADWARELAKYRTSPQYRLVNAGMSLKDFQRIYWFEYVHRLYGRLVGLVLLVPLPWLVWRRRIGRRLLVRVLGIVLLGGAQGALGWYMVASGLSRLPSVSAIRLSLHLTMGLALSGLLLWTALDGLRGTQSSSRAPRLCRISMLLVLASGLTIATGGLVAGTHAGRNYNTFPLMAGKLVPDGLLLFEPAWRNLVENTLTIQFQHRVLALSLAAATLVFAFRLLTRHSPSLRRPALAVALMALVQPTLGVLTLLFHVPIALASLHQMGGFLMFASLVWLTHALRHPSLPIQQAPEIPWRDPDEKLTLRCSLAAHAKRRPRPL